MEVAPNQLVARLSAGRLDRDLACGELPWRSPLHAGRSRQLTSERSRRNIARGLERLVEEAEQPHHVAFTAAAPLCVEQVREARAQLLQAAARLRDGAPVDARGVAQLRLLLSDGAGPAFVRSRPDALSVAVDYALVWLQVPGSSS